MASKFRLFRGDILVTKKPVNDVEKSSIILKLDDEQQEAINFFEVLSVGPDVHEVKEGDVILIRYGEHTPTFDWEGKQVAITDESRIEGVIEND